jgi:hypothetical protein
MKSAVAAHQCSYVSEQLTTRRVRFAAIYATQQFLIIFMVVGFVVIR